MFKNSPILGKFNADGVRAIDFDAPVWSAREMQPKAPMPEELKAAYSRIEELETSLGEARLQLEYLHEKFQPTGTTEATLARIDRVLA